MQCMLGFVLEGKGHCIMYFYSLYAHLRKAQR